MNIQNLLIKIFFGFYLILLLPHILELPLSVFSILILVLGITFATLAHQSKYIIVATLFLVLHMGLELPHMIEHYVNTTGVAFGPIKHHDSGIIIGHGLHIIFDLILLFTLSKSRKYFLLFLCLVIIISFGIEAIIPIVDINNTKPFVLGGVLGCVGTHFLLSNPHKSTA